MSDCLLMENYLLNLKSTTEVYVHGTLESANKDIRAIMKDSLNQILSSQANTYDEMAKYGWYKVKNVDTNTINQTLTELKEKN